MPSYSTTSRISNVPPSYGARLSHSRACSTAPPCHSQYPATSSLVSANGPSITVRLLPSNRTRLLCELGTRRPASSTTPALTSSSLNFWYSAIACGVGAVAASLCSPSLAMIKTRISVSSGTSYGLSFWSLQSVIERQAAFSTLGQRAMSCIRRAVWPERRQLVRGTGHDLNFSAAFTGVLLELLRNTDHRPESG